MYSIISFYTWIDIIGQLFELDGTCPKSFKAWRRLIEPLKKENDIRARLAHHSISQEDVDPGEELRAIQAYLRPAKFDSRSKSKGLKTAYDE